MDPDTRRLMFFAVGLGSVLLSLIAASAIIGRHSTEVPVITADTRPVREKPLNPGGLKIDGVENDVFSGGSDTSNAKLAAPAETPDTKALHTAPPPPISDTPAMTALTPPPVPTLIAPPPAAPVSKPAVVASAPPVAKPAPAKPPVQAAAAEPHPTIPAHQPMVQLAAVASEEGARQEWEQLSKRMPDLLKGHQPNFSRVEREGRTYWRIRTTGFADAAQARAFCEHVRAKGGGCSVTES